MSHKLIFLYLFVFNMFLSLPAQAEDTKKVQIPDPCEIIGKVYDVRRVQKSPWGDGTPSAALSVEEVHLYITLYKRFPYTKVKNSSCGGDTVKGHKMTYKLCSPTKVKKGDMIRATEGTYLISTKNMGCLFDVAIIPQKTGP